MAADRTNWKHDYLLDIKKPGEAVTQMTGAPFLNDWLSATKWNAGSGLSDDQRLKNAAGALTNARKAGASWAIGDKYLDDFVFDNKSLFPDQTPAPVSMAATPPANQPQVGGMVAPALGWDNPAMNVRVDGATPVSSGPTGGMPGNAVDDLFSPQGWDTNQPGNSVGQSLVSGSQSAPANATGTIPLALLLSKLFASK